MSFWASFAKQVILKVLTKGEEPRESGRVKERRCSQCGRMVPVVALQGGRCITCRLEQEHEQQKRDHESHRTRTSTDNTDGLGRAYQILGCAESDSDSDIKKRFRALIKECHVDSLPKDLPEYLVKAANQRFIEVQEAYDRIREARNIA